MLEYNRIDSSDGIAIKKYKETSRECNLCKFYYFLDLESFRKTLIMDHIYVMVVMICL